MEYDIKSIRCPVCGESRLQLQGQGRIALCPVCRMTVLLPRLDDPEICALYDKAELECGGYDFDAALATYRYILAKCPDEIKAYEGSLLAKYGIVYVKENDGSLIPTCHRYNPNPIHKESEYQAFLSYAGEEEKSLFLGRMKEIDRLQKEIHRQLAHEKDYDVFISFKAKNQDGSSSEDSIIARDIYDRLTQSGLRVFLSSVTLKNRLAADYEPIIYKALHSCSFFILVGTSRGNVYSPWVRNEWSRFLDRIKNPLEKVDRFSFVCVYKNMSPAQFPQVDYRSSQCLDAGDLGYLNNLADYVLNQKKPHRDEEEDYRKYARYDKIMQKRLDQEKAKREKAEKEAEEAKRREQEALKKQKEAESIAESRRKRDLEAKALRDHEREIKKAKWDAFISKFSFGIYFSFYFGFAFEIFCVVAMFLASNASNPGCRTYAWVMAISSLPMSIIIMLFPSKESAKLHPLMWMFVEFHPFFMLVCSFVIFIIIDSSSANYLAITYLFFLGLAYFLGFLFRHLIFRHQENKGTNKYREEKKKLDILYGRGAIDALEYSRRLSEAKERFNPKDEN